MDKNKHTGKIKFHFNDFYKKIIKYAIFSRIDYSA